MGKHLLTMTVSTAASRFLEWPPECGLEVNRRRDILQASPWFLGLPLRGAVFNTVARKCEMKIPRRGTRRSLFAVFLDHLLKG